MEKRVTIKEIAAEAGVSTGTVHRALNGKKGVSEPVRQRILDLCAQRGYQTNEAAAALKRGGLRLAAAFPGPEAGVNRYFYDSIWRGVRRQMDTMRGYRIELIELPFYPGTPRDQAAVLSDCLDRYPDGLDGLLTVGQFDAGCMPVLARFRAAGIPIVLACDDAPACGRLACVQADHVTNGRMVGELLAAQLPENGCVLLCAGDLLLTSHSQTAAAFQAYLREHRPDLTCIPLHGYTNEADLRLQLAQLLATRQDITGAFSVCARLSALLIEQAAAQQRAGQIRIVASDLFAETAQALTDGVIQNILFKDPERQAAQAADLLCRAALAAQQPACDVQYVESRLIFRSNLTWYLGGNNK